MSRIDLTRWQRVQHADGTVVLTAPPEHRAFAANRRARLRIRRDVRPIATLEAICDAAAVGTIERAEPSARVVTRAGEYGAIRELRVTVDGEALCWVVGMIVGDDAMTVVDGLARSPAIVAFVRDVLDEDVWVGAHDRIRMIAYRPPPGWFGVRRDMATCWLPPAAPREHATIVVCDAVPRGPAEAMHALMWPLEVPQHATTAGDVSTWTIDHQRWAVARLGDARWSVRAALRAGDEPHLIAFRELVRSIELPPAPAPLAPAAGAAFDWVGL